MFNAGSRAADLAASYIGNRLRARQPAHAPHCRPVVFVSRPTNYADLIVLSMSVVRPRKAMRAECLEEQGEKTACHGRCTPRFTAIDPEIGQHGKII